MKKLIYCIISILVINTNSTIAQISYDNPRVYNLDISFIINPESAKVDRKQDLKVWIPVPREWESQKNVQIISIQPKPHSQFTDSEYGNQIFHWDFGKYPVKPFYSIDIQTRLLSYQINTLIDSSNIKPYDKTSKEYKLYTKSSHTIHITQKVNDLTKEAIGNETNPYIQAQKILTFAHNKIRYNSNLRFNQGINGSLDYMFSKSKK